MFEKYAMKPAMFATIPLPKGKEQLYLSEDGQVLSHQSGLLPVGYDEQGFKTIKADLWNGHKEYKLSLVVLVTYGKLKLPTTYFHLVEPFHIDGDKTNCHPSNIGYRYTHPIECDREPGYYYIPFFNKHVINRDGDIMNWITGKKTKLFIMKPKGPNVKNVTGGYRYVSISCDVGPFSIGRHRAMALTFLPYPDNVDKLDVNHVDGIPGNDWLDNLEWVTRKRNLDHAYESGLRSQNIEFFAKNVFTGEEYSFYSVQDATRTINVEPHAVGKRLNDKSQKLHTGGWLFKLDKDVPWRNVKDPRAELNAQSTPTKALSKNIFTGEIREHESIARIGHDLRFDMKQAPKDQILKGRKRPYAGYLFKLADDTTPWPEFSERELAVFRDNPKGHARGVIARKDNGEELFFTNIFKASEHFKQTLKSRNDVIKAIARNRVVDGYRLYYYDL